MSFAGQALTEEGAGPPPPTHYLRKHGLGDISHPRARDTAYWPKYITNLPAIVTIHFQIIESRNSAG